jgi:hypothetical protein
MDDYLYRVPPGLLPLATVYRLSKGVHLTLKAIFYLLCLYLKTFLSK